MSMSEEDYKYDQYIADLAQEEYEAELIEKSLKTISEDGARRYLVDNGDAAQDRINKANADAAALISQGFFAPSVTASTTAIEIMVRELLLMPLVQGAFLSEEWGEVLTERIVGSRSSDTRKIVPAILGRWGIKIEPIAFDGGTPLWAYIQGELWPKRNLIVHAGAPAEQAEAMRASEAAKATEALIVRPVAAKLGFRLDAGKKWSDGPANW